VKLRLKICMRNNLEYCLLIMQMNECNLKLQINYDQQLLVLLVVDVSECVQEVSVRNDGTFSL